MKLLLASDLHCDADAARRLVQRSAQADVVVGAGDFATVRRGLAPIIRVLRAITRPTILVAGNSETYEELSSACADWPSANVLHGTGVAIDSVEFFGVGGAIPVTPFGAWSYDFTEEQGERLLASCPAGAVLVTHSPPRGLLDHDSHGRSLGSEAVRRVIERVRPRLVVCGHIHGSAGRSARCGTTTIINAGPEGIDWVL